MPSAQVTITQLPAAGPITGTEAVPIVQNGQTRQTTTAAIASSPNQFQTFLTLNQEPTLPNSRALSGSTGITLVDGGALSTLQIVLNGASGSLESVGNGMIAKTASNTVAARTITATGSGLTITDGNGVSGNPTVALSGLAASIANLSGTGIVAIDGGTSYTSVSLTGTPNQINVANGSGPANPTFSIANNPVLPGTGAVTVPVGTTGERPGGSDGQLRFNTSTNRFEGYQAGWTPFGLGDGTVTSVNASGGTTGMSFTGGPITSAGTLTLTGTPTKATNVAGGNANEVVYQTGSDTTGFISAPTLTDTFLKWNGISFVWSALPGSGTVTSVGLAMPTEFTVTNSPVTTSGTLTAAWNSQIGNTFFAAPNGSSGTPTFRAIAAADVPTLNQNTTGQAGSVANSLTANSSGTGDASGMSYDGSAVKTISYNTIGAPKADGTGASGTWAIDISGNAATATTATSASSATSATTATNLAGGSAGSVPYQSGAGATTFLGIGTNGQVITSTGSAPQWTNQSSLSVGSATTATNLAGGAAGSIAYQTGAGTTAMLAAGSGVLVGGTTPSYSTTPSLTGTNFSSIPNSALQYSSITIGSTGISLGGTASTLAGLTSVTVTQNPSTALDLATKQYVDGLVASGITYHTPVKYEVPNTTGNLNAVYNNGTGGVGATLTNAGTKAAFAPDGPTASVGDRILIYNQTNAYENGVYEVTVVGTPDPGGTNWVLTRTTDTDSYGLKDPNALGEGDAFFVSSGDTGAGETYVCNTTGTINFGTTPITFVQVSAAQVYSAGTGLTLTGTQFSLTVPVVAANGGTGLTSYTTGDMVYYATGTALSKLAIGSSSYIMTSTGSAPQWSAPSGITIGTASNIAGGAAGSIPYNSASGTTTFLGIGTSTYLMTSSGSAPQWSDPAGVTVGSATSATSATTATNVAGGAAGSLVYQSGAATTTTLALGTAGYFLTAGATAPQWSDPSGLTVGTATNATNATNASNIGVTAVSTNASFYPVFVSATTGNLAPDVDGDLTYNPSTNTLTAGTMVATTGIFGGTF